MSKIKDKQSIRKISFGFQTINYYPKFVIIKKIEMQKIHTRNSVLTVKRQLYKIGFKKANLEPKKMKRSKTKLPRAESKLKFYT